MPKPSRLVVVISLVFILGSQAFAQTSKADQSALKQLTIPAVTLTYQEQGQGDAVLFVHGNFSDHRVWEAQREAVAKDYRFIAVDLRYHGTEPWPDNGAAAAEKYGASTSTHDLAALTRQLDVDPVHVVGWSSGATVALNFAVQYPQLVRSLVLYEPPPEWVVSDAVYEKTLNEDMEGLAFAFETIEAGDLQKAVKLFSGWVNAQPFETASPQLQTIYLENSRTLELLYNGPGAPPVICTQIGMIGKLEIPVTVIKRQQTRLFFDVAADTTHKCMPGSQLVTLPDARHGGPVQNPPAFNAALLNHLESVRAKE